MSWLQGDKPIEISTCLIIKRRKKYGRWEYQVVEEFKGEWNDLLYELYINYNQFGEEIDHLPNRCAQHDRLDKMAAEYAKKSTSYDFMLPDRTDDWYVAYVKPAVFRIDADGELR